MRLLSVLAAVSLLGGAVLAQESGEGDLLPAFLFPHDLVMDNQEQIGLGEEQVEALSTLLAELDAETAAIHQEIPAASAELREILAQTQINEAQAMASFNTILDLERQARRIWLQRLIRVKNVLAEAQQDQLREITGGER